MRTMIKPSFYGRILFKRLEVFFNPTDNYLTVSLKVYRSGGETDSAIRWRKRTSCDVGERPEEAGC